MTNDTSDQNVTDLNNALRKTMVTAFAAAMTAEEAGESDKAQQYEKIATRCASMRSALNRKPREKK